jgi:hypothetical protein
MVAAGSVVVAITGVTGKVNGAEVELLALSVNFTVKDDVSADAGTEPVLVRTPAGLMANQAGWPEIDQV